MSRKKSKSLRYDDLLYLDMEYDLKEAVKKRKKKPKAKKKREVRKRGANSFIINLIPDVL